MSKTKRPKLPKAFKRRWVAALRSGKFKQGRLRLHTEIDDTYCCLGVAAVVAGHTNEEIGGQCGFGTRLTKIPQLLKQGCYGKVDFLMGMNDGRGPKCPPQSFRQIAAYIERYL